jgi:type II secretory pathway pseudopilin PulG
MFMGITLVQEQASAQYDIERNLFPIQYQGKEGCINKFGELVITPRFDRINCYSSEEKIGFQLNGKYGFVNKNDDIVIGPLFDGISIYQGFREGLASVQKGEKRGFVNAAGEFVIEPQFERAEDFAEGLAAVKINGKWGFIDKIGTFVIEPKFDHVDNFLDGLSRVEIYGKMGVIDQSGKFTIPPIFGGIVGKLKGYHPDYPVPAFINGARWGLINRRGEFVVKPQFDEVAGYFNYNPGEFTGMDTPLPVRSGRQWGYIDVRTGAWVVKPQFDQAYQFSEGLAPVTVGGKTGFIDKNGQFIIKPKFDTFYSFRRGKSLVRIGKKYALIDRNGRSIQIEFDWINEAGNFTDADLFTVSYLDERRTLRREGYVNLLGNYVTDKNVTKLPKKAEVAQKDKVVKLIETLSQTETGMGNPVNFDKCEKGKLGDYYKSTRELLAKCLSRNTWDKPKISDQRIKLENLLSLTFRNYEEKRTSNSKSTIKMKFINTSGAASSVEVYDKNKRLKHIEFIDEYIPSNTAGGIIAEVGSKIWDFFQGNGVPINGEDTEIELDDVDDTDSIKVSSHSDRTKIYNSLLIQVESLYAVRDSLKLVSKGSTVELTPKNRRQIAAFIFKEMIKETVDSALPELSRKLAKEEYKKSSTGDITTFLKDSPSRIQIVHVLEKVLKGGINYLEEDGAKLVTGSAIDLTVSAIAKRVGLDELIGAVSIASSNINIANRYISNNQNTPESYVVLDNFSQSFFGESKNAKVRQSEAKTYVGSMSRAAQAFFLENGKLPITLSQLDIGINSETKDYKYEIKSIGNIGVQVSALSKSSEIKGYTGGVFIIQAGSDRTTVMLVCEADNPGEGNLSTPQLVNGELTCSEGTVRLGK